MENETKETNLSVAIVKPHKGFFSGTKAVNKQVASVAEAKPDLIILPKYTMKSEEVRKAYDIARNIKEDIALFSQTQYPHKIDPYARVNNNPLKDLSSATWVPPYRGGKDWNLDLLVLFGGEEIDPESPVFTNLREGGNLIWIDDLGNHEVFHKRLEGSKTYNFRVFENLEKKINNCSWYDLKF